MDAAPLGMRAVVEAQPEKMVTPRGTAEPGGVECLLSPLGEGPLMGPSRNDGEGPLLRPEKMVIPRGAAEPEDVWILDAAPLGMRGVGWGSHQGGQQSRGASSVCCPPWVRGVGLVVTPRGAAEPEDVWMLDAAPLG